jgi:hypothetical protein
MSWLDPTTWVILLLVCGAVGLGGRSAYRHYSTKPPPPKLSTRVRARRLTPRSDDDTPVH